MILDTERVPKEYRLRLERVMRAFLDDSAKFDEILASYASGRTALSQIATTLGMNRMKLYRLSHNLEKELPTDAVRVTMDISHCPYCGSDRLEETKANRKHCLSSKCGAEFKGLIMVRKYHYQELDVPKQTVIKKKEMTPEEKDADLDLRRRMEAAIDRGKNLKPIKENSFSIPGT